MSDFRGTRPDQVPFNRDLGELAYMSQDGVSTRRLGVRRVQETVFTLTGTEVSAQNGTVQVLNLDDDITLTSTLLSGEAVTLLINDGDTHTVTWPAGVLWVGGVEPTLTEKSLVTLQKIGSDLIGVAGVGIG